MLGSSGLTQPRAMRSLRIHASKFLQKSPPAPSTHTIGMGVALPVCTSVSVSKASSIVPNPPGKSTTASAWLRNMSLRVKK